MATRKGVVRIAPMPLSTMKIAFVWQGFDGRYGVWRDGLWAAMKIIEEKHQVRYYDTTRLAELTEWKPDAVLYWESPCTLAGKDAANYRAVQALPFKKYLLFAGGPIKREWVEGFELLFVESRINEEECAALGIPFKRAFGVNTQIMRPLKTAKHFDGFIPATYAGWKRHALFAQALGMGGVAAGRKQAHEPQCYQVCEDNGVLTLPEVSPETVAVLANASHAVVNTAEFWGGGQRCTLEGMACGVPVIVMSDSPKNREYVEESGGGVVVDPDPKKINDLFQFDIQVAGPTYGLRGLEYVKNHWTEHHYANAILDGLTESL